MLSRKEVQHIAKLARLDLSQAEIEKYRKELSAILDYIEKLKKLEVAEIQPTSHPLKVENVMREDRENEKLKIKNEKLMELAPETKNGYVKVKSILK